MATYLSSHIMEFLMLDLVKLTYNRWGDRPTAKNWSDDQGTEWIC